MDRGLTRRQRINASRAELLAMFSPDAIFDPQRFADVCIALKGEMSPREKSMALQFVKESEFTADAVAVAIVAACRETKERPEDVARKVPAVRARYYACLALCGAYGDVANPVIAKCCGASSASAMAFIPSVNLRRQKGDIKWWSDESLRRVARAVTAHRNGMKPREALRAS